MLLCGAALFVTSVLAVMYNLMQTRRTNLHWQFADTVGISLHREYSFVGEDYPMHYLLDIRYVLLVPEDSVHYGILGPDADTEWKSIPPPGREFVQLGRQGRTFAIALYHQMHCLDIIRHAIGGKNYTNHVHHCFNYLWEAVLCEADTTIELGVPGLDSDVDRARMMALERICKDWTQVYMQIGEESVEVVWERPMVEALGCVMGNALQPNVHAQCGDTVAHVERNVRFTAEIARERTREKINVFYAVDSESHGDLAGVVMVECHPLSSGVSNSTSSDSEVCGDGSKQEYSG
ncbi:hypothetical protein V8D89_008726 [Ganoderma adspersum]